MIQKLLADRFQLKFHQQDKEMSAYVLAVAKTGPSSPRAMAIPTGCPAFSSTNSVTPCAKRHHG